MVKARERYENALLTVRFVGDDLKEHGVSIYDLSTCLLAVQRIIHKAHLAKEGTLAKGSFPDKEARRELALQIGERRRESDGFALIPILADEDVRNYLKELLGHVVSGVVGYYVGDVLDRLKKEKNPNAKIFTGSVFKEVSSIANRIDAAGGVEEIAIASPAIGKPTVIAFNRDTKDYLQSLKGQYFLGSYQEIKGNVYKFYPNSNIVAIRRRGGKTVSIFLSETDFETIRYHKETSPLYLFKGHPRYQLGVETKAVTEFQADEIEYLASEDED